jgi:hypothetical protein
MTIGDILVWESSNLFLLIPVVIGLVILLRWVRGRAVFTERDLAKLLIEKGLITREEFMQKISEERTTYQKLLSPTPQ